MGEEGGSGEHPGTHARELSREGYVVTRVQGRVRVDDFIQAVKDLSAYVQDGRLFELVVHLPSVELLGDFRDIQRFVHHAGAMLSRLEAGAIAFVAPTKLVYGSCRQMRALMVRENVPIEVFVDEAEAREWLRTRVALAKAPAA